MNAAAFLDTCIPALRAGDFATLATLLHPDFRVREASGLPYAGIFHGAEGWRQLSRIVVKTWDGFRFDVIEHHGSPAGTMIVRFAISGRSRRTGRPFETTVLELWRFRDGLLAEIVPYYWDTAELAAIDTP